MAVENNQTQIPKESYITAGTGAAIGGVGTYGVIHSKLSHLAKNTVKAFSGKMDDCDAFVKKNDEIITRAIDSKKGFFGKINKTISSIKKSGDEATDTIAKSTSDVVDFYRDKAAKKLNPKMTGKALSDGINDLSNKYISKDVLKSFKDVKKYETIVKVSGAALLGAIGACVIKEAVKKYAASKQTKQNKSIH